MPEVFVLQPSENHLNRLRSPPIANNDRYTPMPYENSNGKKPEVYYIGKNNNDQLIHDEQPYKPSSPPIIHSYPSSRNGPELYHLKAGDHHNDIPDRRPSPALVSNNRASPVPYQNLNGPEMYYLKVGDESRRQSPPINKKTKFNDTITHDDHDHDQQKIIMYMLKGTEQENLPPLSHIQRTPSPPIRPTKKQQPVSFNIIDNNNKFDIPNKHRSFPTSLHDVSTSDRYVPLSQSKASESIQRSMNKYRFGDY